MGRENGRDREPEIRVSERGLKVWKRSGQRKGDVKRRRKKHSYV